jgi:hypothetical protein
MALRPENVPAVLGAAECNWLLATRGTGVAAVDRRDHLERALKDLKAARELIESAMRRLVALRVEDLPVLETLPFERRAHNRTLLEVRMEYEAELVRVLLKTARVQAQLGDRKQTILALQAGLENLTLTPDLPAAKELEIELRSFLGLNYETIGKDSLALREYRRVLDRLDAGNEACRHGVERLRRRANEDEAGG